MSYTSIPNQPIIFHTEEEIQTPCIECGDGSYRQLVDLNDQLFFQLLIQIHQIIFVEFQDYY
jgi:hypothetical protein